MRIHSEEYEAALARLRQRAGASWGDDGIFVVINQAWVDCCHTTLAAKGALSGVIGDTGTGMAVANRNVREADGTFALPEADRWA